MFPWTTPPTSRPTPPQPATPSSTWPAQPPSIASTSRPPMTWPTTAPSSSSTPQPGYPVDLHQYSINPPHMPGTHANASRHYILRGLLRPLSSRQLPLCRHRHSLPLQQPLIQDQPHTLCLLQLHHWAPTQPPSIRFHQFLQLQRHQHFRRHGQLLLLQLMHRPHHRYLYQAHLTHLVFFNLNHWLPRHQQFLQLSLDMQQSKQPQRFDLRRNLTKYAVQLRRPLRTPLLMPLQLHRLHLHLQYNQNWQHWALRLNNSLNPSASSRLSSR